MPTVREKPRRRPRGGRSNTRQNGRERSAARRHFVAATGEFVGTFLFLLFAFLGHSMSVTQAAETGPNGSASSQTVVFISLSYGFSLLVTAWSLYRISGGLFNPAVTLGLVAAGELPVMRGLFLLPSQLLGAICAAAVASAIIPGPIDIVQTTLGPGMSVVRGLFLEMFLTSQLVFTILVLAAAKSKDTFIAPIGIGLALFIVEIAGVYYTGASVNPARSFGPCVAAAKFQGYHWIYWVGPGLGGILAAGYYQFVKWINYGDIGEANPGQDSAGGLFDARVEERQTRQVEEAQPNHAYSAQNYGSQNYGSQNYDSRTYGPTAQPQTSWSGGGQSSQTWNAGLYPTQYPPQQGWAPNTYHSTYPNPDQQSAEINRRRV